jgi:hypothetical protein
MMPRGVPNNLFAIYYFTFTHSLNLPLPPPHLFSVVIFDVSITKELYLCCSFILCF